MGVSGAGLAGTGHEAQPARRSRRRQDHDEQDADGVTHEGHHLDHTTRRAAGQRRWAIFTGSQSDTFRSRSAFAITDTELNVIAALAIIGLSSRPKNG